MLRFQYIFAILACSFLSQAWADDLEVRDVWIREAPPVAKSHAAYMELVNNGDTKVDIISVLADDYGMVMLHKTVEKNGMTTMEHVDNLVIPPHASVRLQPGALHIMLMSPKRKLKAGDTVKITLVFDRDRRQDVLATVRAAP
jgi:copper(I)-binding protein